jgi:hypothetical protein
VKPAWVLPATLALVTSTRVNAHVPACETAKLELRAASSALTLYAAGHDGALPPRTEWIASLRREDLMGARWKGLDPWGHQYVYWRKGSNDFELRTVGADGSFGTGDDQQKQNGWTWATCRDPAASCGLRAPP